MRRGIQYFDTPTVGPLCAPVAQAVQRVLSEWASGVFDWERWAGQAEMARARFARLLDLDAGDVALTGGVSYAAGLVADSVPAGGNVVVGAREFASNLHPWLAVAAARGVEVRLAPQPDGRLEVAALAARMNAQTRVVAVSAVQSETGWRVDLPAVVEAAHRVGAAVFVDASQMAGALALWPRRWDLDYVACSSYKWLLGAKGAGYLYVRRDRQAMLRSPWATYTAMADPHRSYYAADAALAADARRFDPTFPWLAYVADAAALQLLLRVGIARIQGQVTRLTGALRSGLEDLGYRIAATGPGGPANMVSVRGGPRLRSALRRQRIQAAVRGDGVRLGPHFFNTGEEVATVLAVCQRVAAPRG